MMGRLCGADAAGGLGGSGGTEAEVADSQRSAVCWVIRLTGVDCDQLRVSNDRI